MPVPELEKWQPIIVEDPDTLLATASELRDLARRALEAAQDPKRTVAAMPIEAGVACQEAAVLLEALSLLAGRFKEHHGSNHHRLAIAHYLPSDDQIETYKLECASCGAVIISADTGVGFLPEEDC